MDSDGLTDTYALIDNNDTLIAAMRGTACAQKTLPRSPKDAAVLFEMYDAWSWSSAVAFAAAAAEVTKRPPEHEAAVLLIDVWHAA